MFQHDYSTYAIAYRPNLPQPVDQQIAKPIWPQRPAKAAQFLKSWTVTHIKLTIECAVVSTVLVLILLLLLPTLIPDESSRSRDLWLVVAGACLVSFLVGSLVGRTQANGLLNVAGELPGWALASGFASAAGTGVFLVLVMSTQTPSLEPPAIWRLLIPPALVGAAQWNVLRNHFGRAWAWLPGPLLVSLELLAVDRLQPVDLPVGARIVLGAAHWVAYVLATGLVMWWITQKPRPSRRLSTWTTLQALCLAAIVLLASIATSGELIAPGRYARVNAARPGPVYGLDHVVAIDTADDVSFAVKQDGTVWTWGWDTTHVMGVIPTETCALIGADDVVTPQCTDTPIQVPGLTDIVDISASATHVLALDRHGRIWSWGNNQGKQLGHRTVQRCFSHPDPAARCFTKPSVIEDMSGVQLVAAGQAFSLALLADGTVKWWGYISNNAISSNVDCSHRDRSNARVTADPRDVLLEDRAVDIEALGTEAVAVLANGRAFKWDSDYGCGEPLDLPLDEPRLEVNKASSYLLDPATLLLNIARANSNAEFLLVLDRDGRVFGWGDDQHGQLGGHAPDLCWVSNVSAAAGERPCARSPHRIDLPKVVDIASGSRHGIALTADGLVLSWGFRDNNSIRLDR